MTEPSSANGCRAVGISLRIVAFYVAYSGTLGVLYPFWPVWLESRGLTKTAIGVVIGTSSWARVVGGPMFARIADRYTGIRPLMIVLPLLSLAGYAGFASGSDLFLFVPLAFLVGATFPALLPLGETLALRYCEQQGMPHGRLRLWGPLGFVLASVGTGQLLTELPPSSVLPTILATIVITEIVCIALPPISIPVAKPRPSKDVLRVLIKPPFLLFLACNALFLGSHATYYGFSSIHWREAGHSETIVGILWAEGFIAEAPVFLIGSWLLRRLPVSAILALGGFTAAIRWSILANTSDLTVLFLTQALHGVTYAAPYLASLAYIRQSIPEDMSATATSVLFATTFGVALGALTPLAGLTFEEHGSQAFLLSAAISCIGVTLTVPFHLTQRRAH